MGKPRHSGPLVAGFSGIVPSGTAPAPAVGVVTGVVTVGTVPVVAIGTIARLPAATGALFANAGPLGDAPALAWLTPGTEVVPAGAGVVPLAGLVSVVEHAAKAK